MEKKILKIKDNIKGGDKTDPVQEFINKHKIDMCIWYVDSFKIKDGSWNTAGLKRDQDLTWTKNINHKGDVTQIMEGSSKRWPEFILAENKTYSIEVTFKRNPIEISILDEFKELVNNLPSFGFPTIRNKRNTKNSGIAAEIALYDAHFGKLAWKDETGYRHYDTKIAEQDYSYASDFCLNLISPHKPEKIFYIVGNDLYHIDNMKSHTTKGDHTLDVDGRITKVHKSVFKNVRDSIYKASLIAPVEVIWIPGNHDTFASYTLVFTLAEHFKDYDRVTVDVTEVSRKARLWGNLLVGWTHRIVGKHNVWSNELAQAFPEMWGKSKFREWHHGDQHKKQNVKVFPIFTSGSVLCRQITALSPVDHWHTENVFTDAVPGGEAYLWSKELGVFANYIAWTGQYEDNRNSIIKNK